MKAFISGGCKNGKSHYAQELAVRMARAQGRPLYYLATMIPHDEEDRARIRRHLREREGLGFETVERGFDICRCLDETTVSGKPVRRDGIFLLDSVTALLANEMFPPGGDPDRNAPQRLAEELAAFAAAVSGVVFVSDYIYSDAFIYDELTESYRRGLAFIDRRLAAICEQVSEVSYGFVKQHKAITNRGILK